MYGFDSALDLFSIMFFIVFFLIVITIIVNFIKGINEWSNNNKQPILDTKCKIVSKRNEIIKHSGHTYANGMYYSGHTSTCYYITFEIESNDRIEFSILGNEFGVIAEGDIGMLKFQGNRYLEFTRDF